MTEQELNEIESKLRKEWVDGLESERSRSLSRQWLFYALPALHDHALSQKELAEEQYEEQLHQSWDLTNLLYQSLHVNWEQPAKGEEPKGFWEHRQFDALRLDDIKRGFAIYKEALEEQAALYLRHEEFRSDNLDWIFLDALVFSELEAFVHHASGEFNPALQYARGSKVRYRLLVWVFRLVPFLAPVGLPIVAFLLKSVYAVAAICVMAYWLIDLVYRACTSPPRWRAKRAAIKAISHLSGIYAVLGQLTISTRHLRQLLDSATADGVVFPEAVYAIVDRSIAYGLTAQFPQRV
jgi:hypothetical protein